MAVTDLTGTTWVINENPNPSTLPNTSINFTSNEMSFSSIHYFSSPDNPAAILYGDTYAWSMGVWINEAFRTVIFETSPTGDLLTWLEANATQQAVSTKVTVDLTTLTGWSSLSTGSHNITVIAKADGYRDSEPSAAVSVEKAAEVYTDCITFTGESSDFTLKATNKSWDGTLYWSTDHTNWTILTGREAMQSVNKKLYLRGKGNTTFLYDDGDGGEWAVQWQLSSLAKCNGNIQTLLDYENPPTSISLPACYLRMFYGCTNLITPPELPATILKYNCYGYMFEGCTSLTKAPELPATTLADYCYNNMFSGCTSLTKAPELPATTLANYCYDSMFRNCTSLIIAPKLPATTLTNGCYRAMFWGCTKLTVPPELPATILKTTCYEDMFRDCTSLTKAPELPATTLANHCCQYMFRGCSKLKVNTTSGNKIFTCPSSIPSGAVNGMFSNTSGTFTGTPTAGTTYYWTE